MITQLLPVNSVGRTSDAREKLIQTAMQLIWQRGYSAVGVGELCREAGVNPGSFYYFFPSKRDLVLAALEENWRLTHANVLEPAFSADVSPGRRISRIFELAYQQQVTRQRQTGRALGCAFGSLGSELGHQDEIVRQKVEEIFGRFCAYFERALEEAVAAGQPQLEDIPTRARALLAYLEGTLLLARTHNNAELVNQLGPMAIAVAGLNVEENS